VRRVLITGMSGTGKSGVIAELAALGYKAVDENQAKFHSQFDHIILLSAPMEVLTQRLAARTNNPFGKSALEFRRFQADVQEVEPLLRGIADREIDATLPLSQVVRAILDAVGAQPLA